MSPANSQHRGARGHRFLVVMLALFAFTTITATHGVMPEDEMHHDGAVECLATTADVSTAKTCASVLETAATREAFSVNLSALAVEGEVRPTPTGARARHGPSDLQVFRT